VCELLQFHLHASPSRLEYTIISMCAALEVMVCVCSASRFRLRVSQRVYYINIREGHTTAPETKTVSRSLAAMRGRCPRRHGNVNFRVTSSRNISAHYIKSKGRTLICPVSDLEYILCELNFVSKIIRVKKASDMLLSMNLGEK
jgi:hypothetical protein